VLRITAIRVHYELDEEQGGVPHDGPAAEVTLPQRRRIDRWKQTAIAAPQGLAA